MFQVEIARMLLLEETPKLGVVPTALLQQMLAKGASKGRGKAVTKQAVHQP